MGPFDLLDFFDRRGKDIGKMPVTFWSGAVIALILGFSGGLYWRAQEVANAQSLVTLREAKIAELQKQVDDDANIVKDAKSAYDEYSKEQIEKLKQGLQSSDSKTAGPVSFVGPSTPSLGSTAIYSTFKDTGWDVKQGTLFDYGYKVPANVSVIQPTTVDSYNSIVTALEGAKIPYEVKPPATGAQVSALWLPTTKTPAAP